MALPLVASVLVTSAAAVDGSSRRSSPMLSYSVARVSTGDHPHWYYGICLSRSDGSHAVQFASFHRNGQPNLIAEGAVWSPNGKYVALFRGRYFVIADARGHIVRRLYNWDRRTGYVDRDAVWSPNGRWIAVVTGRLTEIMVLPASGKGKRAIAVRVPFGSAAVESPSWTPDSKRIVFFAQWESPSTKPGIFSVTRTGKDRRLVIPGNMYREPELSPDGSNLAAVVPAGDSGSYIAVANDDGSDAHRVSDPDSPFAVTPTWSPDGTKIAYRRSPSKSSAGGIAVVRADGSGGTVAVADRSGFAASEPSWRPGAPLPAAKRRSCS